MKHHGAVLVLLCVLCPACNSKELTRSKAAEILSKQFPRPVTYNLVIGRIGSLEPTLERHFKTDLGRVEKLEQADGLISVAWTETPRHEVRVELSDKGKSCVAGGGTKDGVMEWVPVRVCEDQFGEVTGITMIDPNNAQVDYTSKRGNLTPFGRQQIKGGGANSIPCSDVEPKKESAILTLYDDGWRIHK